MSESAASPGLRIHLLGKFQVWMDIRPIPPEAWRLRKAAMLVKLLALTPGHRLHRERVLELLWPELDVEAAVRNLHYTLHVARGTLHPYGSALRLEQEQIVLAPLDRLWIDVEAFETLAARARRTRLPADYGAALALYTGDLLPDDLYDDWAFERREGLHALALSLYIELARLFDQGKDVTGAIDALQRAILLEPACEEAHAELMRMYSQSGQRHQALRQYERLQRALQAELDSEPSAATQRLFDQVRAGNVPAVEPTPKPERRAASTERHNLPAPVTSFIGRAREVREIHRLLTTTRLLTLLGSGGSGKTRLALEAAELVLDAYRDGIWLVELASITDEALVPAAIAQVVQVTADPERSTETALSDWLRERQVLLLLDNCEHLIDAVARLTAVLLTRCPHLTILATSREALSIAGEVTLSVPPLTNPRTAVHATPGELLTFDAIRLLVERARYRQPSFQLDADNASAAVAICQRLEGLPLAIELAAARVSVLSLQQIASRLHDSLGLLTVHTRASVPRQQSLRAALQWSYDLLAPEERILFRQLAVFARGWTLEAAQAIVSGDGIHTVEVLDLLSHLVDKSLVITERSGQGEIRYRLLEPVRQYAREQLESSGELNEIQRRQATFLLSLLGEARLGLTGPEQPAWLHRLDAERDNLRSALVWSEIADPALGFEIASLVWFPWYIQGHLHEAREWLDRMFAVTPTPPPPVRILALRGLGATAQVRGDYRQAIASLDEALDVCRELGDDEQAGRVLNQLAIAVKNSGDYARATALHEESLAMRRMRGDREGVAESLVNLGSLCTSQGDWSRAEAFFEEALGLEREFGDDRMVAIGLNNLGELWLRQGDIARAEPHFTEALALGRDLGEVEVIFSCLDGLARDAHMNGLFARAVRLHGAADAIRRQAGFSLHADRREVHDRAVTELREAAGETAFMAAWNEGASMELEPAVAYALARDEPAESRAAVPPDAKTDRTHSPLSAREHQVALLVAQGLTNRQISRELTIAERTVDTHVSKILRKLELSSRVGLARWVGDH